MQLEKASSDLERVVGGVVGKDHDEKIIRTIVDVATPETDDESSICSNYCQVFTYGEVEQLKLLLESAGEAGPFVLAGHSFGGLFSANFAHHHPDLVAGVVLLDSTPPWNVAFVGKLSFSIVLRKAWWGALASVFAFDAVTGKKLWGFDPIPRDASDPAHASWLGDF